MAALAGTVVLPLAQAAPCEAPEHRQFDFWLGDWEVRTPDGTLRGTNRIERGYDGCVIHERYASVRTFRGESLNAYDPARKRWHQTWVDNSGTLLLLEGGMSEGRMVLEGQTLGDGGRVIRHRITWTPAADGSVRQLWQSTGAKGDWKTTFDGRYSRK